MRTTLQPIKERFPQAAVKIKLLGYPALVSILKLKPDYFVGTGDNVYYDGPLCRARRDAAADKEKNIRNSSHSRDLLISFSKWATYWMKDDHDFRFNDSDPIKPLPCGAQL